MSPDKWPRLEVLPYGRTLEQQETLERNKHEARQILKGCLFVAVLFALGLCYIWGYLVGKGA